MSLRIGGLITGLDTHALIEQLISTEKRPIAAMQSRVKALQSKQSSWKSIAQRLSSLDSLLAKLQNPRSYSQLTANSSQADAVKASITGEPVQGTWTVEVERLARARVIASDSFSTVGPGQFSLNGVAVDISTLSDVHDLARAINNAGAATYQTQVNSEGQVEISGQYNEENDASFEVRVEGRDVVVIKNGEPAQTYKYALDQAGNGTLRISGLSIKFLEVNDGDNVVIDAQAARNSGVRASVVDNRLLLQGNTHEPIDFDDPQGLLKDIGVLDDQGSEKNVLVEGNAARITINGLAVERDSNLFKNIIQGINLEITAIPEKAVQLTVTQDVESVTSDLADFVQQYNGIIRALKQDGFSGETLAMRLAQAMRSVVGSTFAEGDIRSLRELGISFPNRTDFLEIDLEKVKTLASNAMLGLSEFLHGSEGFVAKLKEVVKGWSDSKGIISSRLDTFTRQIRTGEDNIRAAQHRLERKEEQLWRRFVAMERALSTLNSQGNWLSGQINSLPGYTRNER